ncbi:MAG TPA: helix-turn-helix domain-containing protein [Actinoplanes sp.]
MSEPLPRAPRRRLPPDERRLEVLRAAVTAFAHGGYQGTTTDDIARLAGVSQPYVVRLLGSKQALFIAAHVHVIERITAAFRAAVAEREPQMPPLDALRGAYLELIADRDLLRVMQHGFAAGADPAFGPVVRASLIGVYSLIRDLTSATVEEARDFMATGILINTLVCVELPEHGDESHAAAELLRSTLGDHTATS